jgi:hypothetical protein
MVREALTELGLAVLVSGTLGALIYLGADALMEFLFFVIAITREGITSNTRTVGRSDVILITNVHATV